jgi:hypothetical protein
MFEFFTHGLLFAFISLLFWVPGLVGYTKRSFLLTVAIGFLVGGFVSFFRDKQLISPANGRNVRMLWKLFPILFMLGLGAFVLWGLSGLVTHR